MQQLEGFECFERFFFQVITALKPAVLRSSVSADATRAESTHLWLGAEAVHQAESSSNVCCGTPLLG